MNDKLYKVIGAYYTAPSAVKQFQLLEIGATLIEQGALEPFEEDRLYEALKPRVAVRYGT